jgi:uncharacterized lipoprotein YddW (UPF0748 family)
MFVRLAFYILFISALCFAQPKEEVRAVWITTVFNLDWPYTSGMNNQTNEMRNLLDVLRDANFNTIMLQVRARGDLLYPSAIEPWSKALTGSLSGNPGYDPLQFVIDEAHKRGIEVHAWWNVYKVYGTGTPPSTNPPHVVLAKSKLCKTYLGEWWMDPGIPETKNYLLNLAMEMIRKYDIDAIHFDFIRYPNPNFDDEQTYQLYGQGINKNDWRRNNITQFVYALYDSVQAVKPLLKVGSAPIGIYKKLSDCLTGFLGFDQVFQDSRRWILARKHDYLSPQIYWDINTCPRYDSLAIDWIQNRNGRHIYPAVAVYRMSSSEGDWPVSEILAQVDSTRKFGGQGQTFYRTQSIYSNQKDVRNLLKNNHYKYPANIPPMPWKDDIKPNAPVNLTLTALDSTSILLKWEKPLPAADGDTAIYYNIYLDVNSPADISDVKKMIKFRLVDDTSFVLTFQNQLSNNYYFAVTAYDKGYNESLPAEAAYIISSISEKPIIAEKFFLYQNYPNPFNPSTKIKYYLSEEGYTKLSIHDILGNEIAVLVEGTQRKGSYEVNFENPNLASGLYFYTLRNGTNSASRKMIYLR